MMAKSLLENRDIPFETINIDEDEQAKEFVISEGHRTMPQIYQNGELYVEGGFNGLKEKLNYQIDTTQLGTL
jgi:glutaredoxin